MYSKLIHSGSKNFLRYRNIPPLATLALIILSIVLLVAMFWLTEVVHGMMIRNTRRIMNTHARLWALSLAREIEGPELTILFEEVIEKADFPVLFTTADCEPHSWRNLPVASGDTTQKGRKKVKRWLEKNRGKYPPIAVRIPETNKAYAYIFFGESPVMKWLRIAPIIEMIIICIMFAIGGIIYSKVKRYERQNLWLSLAKEAAHQMGTPTSSLLGWIQLINDEISSSKDLNEIRKYIFEMERDVNNLSKIVVRFGQIGSKPELSPVDPIDIAKDVAGYLKDRIPQLNKKIKFEEQYESVPMVMANKLLLSWALENLIKNSVESIGAGKGSILVALRNNVDGDEVHFIVSDTGKGVPLHLHKRIFSTGFTTKKRGWGIGLSLTRRIVQDYHHGKLYLLESKSYLRTTFIIALPLINASQI